MGKTIEWHVGDPCPNCGGPVPLVPRPPADRVLAAKDPANGVPVPQIYDTAPEHVIDELGDLYRCRPCWSNFRVKSAPVAALHASTAE